MGGSVPCPSCKGSGRIPIGMSTIPWWWSCIKRWNGHWSPWFHSRTIDWSLEERVSLLLMKGLHCFRCLWVLIGIGICLLLAGMAIFLLVPRTIELLSKGQAIEVTHVTNASVEQKSIKFHFIVSFSSLFFLNSSFQNSINISNANFYSVNVANTSAVVTSRFRPYSTEVLGHGDNVTSIVVPSLSSTTILSFNNSVTLRGDAAWVSLLVYRCFRDYCQSPYAHLTSLYMLMQFAITVTVTYLGHFEQVTLTTQQQVCCIPSGNCTQLVWNIISFTGKCAISIGLQVMNMVESYFCWSSSDEHGGTLFLLVFKW